jgi:hypothetical protein
MHVLKHHHSAPSRRHPAWLAWSVAFLVVIACLSALTAWQRHALGSATAAASGVTDERSVSRTDSSLPDQAARRNSSGMTASEFKRMYEGDSTTAPPLWYGF